MRQEKIPFYQTNDFLILDIPEGELDHFECREKLGFHRKKIASPIFYQDYDFFEIFVFSNVVMGVKICELWDSYGEVFCFATDSQLQTMELVERYLKIVKDIVSIEKELKKLDEDEN